MPTVKKNTATINQEEKWILAIRVALIEAEEWGFSGRAPEQIKAAVIGRRKGNGRL